MEWAKTCPTCGTEFKTEYNFKTYCSSACRRKWNKQKKIKSAQKYPVKTCPHCKKEFEARKAHQKYCSAFCQYASQYSRQRAEREQTQEIFTKTCPICGREFKTTLSIRLYCSDACHQSARSERSARYYANQKELRSIKSAEKVDEQTLESRRAQREENFNRLIDEAEQCGLSYGMYTAQLRLGKTFEELHAAHLETLADHYNG